MMNFDINSLMPSKNKVEVQARKKQQVEYKYIGSMKHNSSHILFAINTKTGEIHQAKYKENKDLSWEEALKICQGSKIKREVVIEKDCIYIEAMNEENALKKYKKGKVGFK